MCFVINFWWFFVILEYSLSTVLVFHLHNTRKKRYLAGRANRSNRPTKVSLHWTVVVEYFSPNSRIFPRKNYHIVEFPQGGKWLHSGFSPIVEILPSLFGLVFILILRWRFDFYVRKKNIVRKSQFVFHINLFWPPGFAFPYLKGRLVIHQCRRLTLICSHISAKRERYLSSKRTNLGDSELKSLLKIF